MPQNRKPSERNIASAPVEVDGGIAQPPRIISIKRHGGGGENKETSAQVLIMSDEEGTCMDFIRRLADLNLYIVVETIVQHAGYEATVNMLCVSKVGARKFK